MCVCLCVWLQAADFTVCVGLISYSVYEQHYYESQRVCVSVCVLRSPGRAGRIHDLQSPAGQQVPGHTKQANPKNPLEVL